MIVVAGGAADHLGLRRGVAGNPARRGMANVTRLLRTSQARCGRDCCRGRANRRRGGAAGARSESRSSQDYAVPFQYGLFRPVVLLPERMCQSAYRGQLPGVVAHELAHVISGDFAWNAIMHVVSTLLWFHPLAWRIGSVHRAACDSVCDAVAASYLGDVPAYCRTLAQVALEGAGLFPVLAMPMARTCDARRRIARLQERVFARSLSRRASDGCRRVASVGLAWLPHCWRGCDSRRRNRPRLTRRKQSPQRQPCRGPTFTAILCRPAQLHDWELFGYRTEAIGAMLNG